MRARTKQPTPPALLPTAGSDFVPSNGVLAAISYIDNWDGQEDRCHCIAAWQDGEWVTEDGGGRLLEYEGSKILSIWPMTPDRAVDSQNSRLSSPETPLS